MCYILLARTNNKKKFAGSTRSPLIMNERIHNTYNTYRTDYVGQQQKNNKSYDRYKSDKSVVVRPKINKKLRCENTAERVNGQRDHRDEQGTEESWR